LHVYGLCGLGGGEDVGDDGEIESASWRFIVLKSFSKERRPMLIASAKPKSWSATPFNEVSCVARCYDGDGVAGDGEVAKDVEAEVALAGEDATDDNTSRRGCGVVVGVGQRDLVRDLKWQQSSEESGEVEGSRTVPWGRTRQEHEGMRVGRGDVKDWKKWEQVGSMGFFSHSAGS
jgi:hypothetical protein